MATPYPSAFQIEEMLANRDIPDIFHTYLADPMMWLSLAKTSTLEADISLWKPSTRASMPASLTH